MSSSISKAIDYLQQSDMSDSAKRRSRTETAAIVFLVPNAETNKRTSRKPAKAADAATAVITNLPAVSARAVSVLAERLAVKPEVVLAVSQIPTRTYHRREKENTSLTPTEADRILRIARVASEAERVFGSPEKAQRWLSKPNAVLGAIPLTLLGSDAGARDVEAELTRIDWGDFI